MTTSSFSFCAETDNIIFCTTITTFELIQTILLWLFLYKCFTNWNNFSNVITNWKFCIAYIPLTLRSIVMIVLLLVFHILKHFLQCVHNLTILYCVNTIDINENDESCLHISMKSHFLTYNKNCNVYIKTCSISSLNRFHTSMTVQELKNKNEWKKTICKVNPMDTIDF